MDAEDHSRPPMLGQFDLSGRVAIVTGASRGIGVGLAEALAGAGADVALVARTESALLEVAGRLRSLGRRVLPLPADLSEVDHIRRMVDRVVAEFGRIDILVNAAGSQARKPILDVTESDWERVVAVNLRAVFFCTQAVARQMMKQGKGKVINIASLTASIGVANVSVYGATKGGVLALTRAMAREWAKHGINVNAIGPGYVPTDLTRHVYEEPVLHQWVLSRTPMGRWSQVEDLQGAAVFLASDASDFITGQLVNVDGGWLAS